MTSLRAEVDRIIDQHFEPSVMGRAQCVDEIMEAIKVEVIRLAEVTTARMIAAPSGETRQLHAPVINVFAPTSGPDPVADIQRIVEDSRRARSRRRGW